MTRPVLARDLGDGPHRPFGSALSKGDGAIVERCPRIGRTVKPRAAGPCPICSETRWFCDCEGDEE